MFLCNAAVFNIVTRVALKAWILQILQLYEIETMELD